MWSIAKWGPCVSVKGATTSQCRTAQGHRTFSYSEDWDLEFCGTSFYLQVLGTNWKVFQYYKNQIKHMCQAWRLPYWGSCPVSQEQLPKLKSISPLHESRWDPCLHIAHKLNSSLLLLVFKVLNSNSSLFCKNPFTLASWGHHHS